MSTLRDAIKAVTRDSTPKTPELKVDTQGKLLADSPGDVKNQDNNALARGVVSAAKQVGAGVVSAGNELVTGATTMYGAVTGDQEVIDEAEARRKGLNQDLNTFRDAEDSNVAENVAFGISKYLLGAGGVGAGVGKGAARVLGGALSESLAIGAGTALATGAITYQETKSDLMESGVSREDANTVGIIQGIGMGASVGIPVAGLGRITSIKQGASKVLASSTVSTGAMSGTSAVTGVYLGNRANELKQEASPLERVAIYQEASNRFNTMATDPTSIAIGLGLSTGIGALVAKGKLQQYRSDVATINALKGSLARYITPSLLDDINLGRVDSPEMQALATKVGKEDLELLTNIHKGNRKIATQEDIDNGITQEKLDLEYIKEIEVYIRTAVANRVTANDIDTTLLTDSDRLLIANNDKLLLEYSRTGDASLLDGLEIPQVHRDAYLLDNAFDDPYGLDTSIVKSNYFEPTIRAIDEGKPYVAPSTQMNYTNTRTRGDKQTYVHEVIGKAEGSYTSLNRGKAGDAPNAKLSPNATIADIQQMQALPAGNPNRVFAVGKYQIIPDTLEAAVKYLKLSPNTKFTPELQERIFRDYLLKVKKSKVYDYITGKNNNLEGAQLAMAQEFASVGIPRAIGGKGKDSSYYAGQGNNKASISSRDMALALESQRARYKKLIDEGIDPQLAWDRSFYPDQNTQLSATVTRDISSTSSTNKDGSIYTNPNRDEVIDIPNYDAGILARLKEGYANAKVTTTNLLTGKNEPLPYARENTYDLAYQNAIDKGFDDVAAQSRAIQKVYEEKSYQYALNMRNKARDEFGIDGQELDNVLQNAYNKHQNSLKIGKSKIFDDELITANTLYPNNTREENIALALNNTNKRANQASYITTAPAVDTGVIEDAKTKLQDSALDRNIAREDGTSIKIVEEETKWYTDKDGNRIPYRTTKNATDATNTKAPDTTNAKSIESVVKLEDGATLTRISTRLPNGKVINRFIDNNGNISNFAATSRSPTLDQLTALVQMRLQGADTIELNGQTVSKQELLDQLNNTRKIESNALEQFALCALP